MPSSPELLTDYLESVSGEIRWPRARRLLLGELRSHIEDQRRDFEGSGLNGADALAKAVTEMGDPVAVGRDLNRLHRPHNAWGVVLLVLLLTGVGVVFAGNDIAPLLSYSLSRQLFGAALGGVLMLGLWFSDYTLLLRRVTPCAAVFCAALLLIGPAYSILHFGRFESQSRFVTRPLIYLTLLSPVLFAAILCHLRGKKYGAVLFCGLLSPALALPALLTPSVAASLCAVVSMVLVLIYAVWSGWFPVKRLVGLICACLPSLLLGIRYFLILLSSGRLALLFHPERDPLGKGFQAFTFQAFMRDVPWVNTSGAMPEFGDANMMFGDFDFLLFRLAARFGRIVLVLVALLTALFIFLALRRFSKLHSRQGQVIALSALFVLAAEAFGYTAYNCGFMLFSPLAFPFLSYGAAALVINFCLLGLILSVLRMDTLVRDTPSKRQADTRPGSLTIQLPFLRGKIHIGYEKT